MCQAGRSSNYLNFADLSAPLARVGHPAGDGRGGGFDHDEGNDAVARADPVIFTHHHSCRGQGLRLLCIAALVVVHLRHCSAVMDRGLLHP